MEHMFLQYWHISDRTQGTAYSFIFQEDLIQLVDFLSRVRKRDNFCDFLFICLFTGVKIQSNFNGSNTDGSFTMTYSNSFLSPYGIFPTAQENKY